MSTTFAELLEDATLEILRRLQDRRVDSPGAPTLPLDHAAELLRDLVRGVRTGEAPRPIRSGLGVAAFLRAVQLLRECVADAIDERMPSPPSRTSGGSPTGSRPSASARGRTRTDGSARCSTRCPATCCCSIVQAHGGAIDVRSQDERTTLTVRLPC